MPGATRLLAAFLIALAVVAAANAATARVTSNSMPRQTLEAARTGAHASVVALGNSLVQAGFDAAAFDASAGLSRDAGSLNLGLGSTMPVEHLLLLRELFRHGAAPRLVVYGFFDFQLSEPTRFAIGDMIGNHSMLYEQEPWYARQFYELSRRDAVEFRAFRRFPLFTQRGTLWAKVERLRRLLGEQGMPPEKAIRFGRANDFGALEAASSQVFAERCVAELAGELNPAVDEILRTARSHGSNVVVVAMPMPASHRARFYALDCWQRYVSYMGAELARRGAQYLDCSDSMGEDAFDDPLHVNGSGAVRFSRELGSVLKGGADQSSASCRFRTVAPPRL